NEEEHENRKSNPVDLIGHDEALALAMQNSGGFVGRKPPIDQPDQQRTDRDPRQLVPIEERKAEQRRLRGIVERHPQQADKRQQQQDPHGGAPFWASAADRFRSTTLARGKLRDRIGSLSSG